MTEEQLSRLEKLEAEATWKTINWDGPDAELIAAMRNALPELLQMARYVVGMQNLSKKSRAMDRAEQQ